MRRSLKMSSRNRALKYGATKTTSLVSSQPSAFYILVALSNLRPQTQQCKLEAKAPTWQMVTAPSLPSLMLPQCQLEAKALSRRDNRHCPVLTLTHVPHLVVARFASVFQQARSAWLGTAPRAGDSCIINFKRRSVCIDEIWFDTNAAFRTKLWQHACVLIAMLPTVCRWDADSATTLRVT